MTAGRLQIAASRDLGGLGATEGPPLAYNWTTAGLGAQVLPWLMILGLLALKPNRGWAAWWIWLPLAAVVAGCHWLLQKMQSLPGNAPGEALAIFLNVPVAWGFGLAALWLLASHLGRHDRFRILLASVTLLAGFTVFSFGALAGWGLAGESLWSLVDPRHCAATSSEGLIGMPLLIPLVLPAPVVAVALGLCGLACRGRYRPVMLYFWLIISLLAAWIAVSGLLYAWFHAALPGCPGYFPFLAMALVAGLVTFGIWLPFLIVASASPLFRERLKGLLHVKPAVPAAVGAVAVVPA